MFNQRIRRALDRPVDAAGAQQAAYQRRLAGAETAFERDNHSAREERRDACAAGFGRGGIGQVERQR